MRMYRACSLDIKPTEEQVNSAFEKLSFVSDLATAVKDADLVIEAVPESPAIKKDFYGKLSAVAPAKTVFASNSSTLLPSSFAEATGRPDKFLALHFANNIWINNTAEIMGHPGTSKEVFDDVVSYAKAMGMITLPLHKEQPGYILNTLLVPFLKSGLYLWANDIADPEIIDKTWMIATGSPVGPFGVLDVVGLTTVYNIYKMNSTKSNSPYDTMLLEKITERIAAGLMGTESGEGFYKYPNPAYKDKNFLKQ